MGLISGRVVDSVTGAPIAGAPVVVTSDATATRTAVRTGAAGYYAAPSLPPGAYRVRVSADRYQPQEVFQMELAVAGRLEADFRLRPLSDVWESGQTRSVFLPGSRSLVTFFGPDVDSSRTSYVESQRRRRGALEATVSQTIDPVEVRDLPLAGRDVYTMLVTQGGVTADGGTARGLGLSSNGQRPSSSNFFLDGVQNNNFLVTGPLTAIAPEAVQEYRVSTNNFSAEYGGAAGFVANAVTRAGGNRWHGIAYLYGKRDALNATGFQQNRLGLGKPESRETQPGFQLGGPIVANRLFASSALEALRSFALTDPVEYRFPSVLFRQFTSPGGLSRMLLDKYPAPFTPDVGDLSGPVTMRPPNTVNRFTGLHRGDWVMRGGKHRVTGRVALSRVDRPDFIWTPYSDFVSGFTQNDASAMGGIQNSLRPALVHEARFARHIDDIRWDRAHPEIPTLATGERVVLPGSPAMYAYRNRTRAWEFQDNLAWVRGAHVARFGGSFLRRGIDGYLTAARDARYEFPTIIDYALDSPSLLLAPLDRAALPRRQVPGYDREYRQTQFSLFAQDAFRVSPNLTLNFGVRYESLGAPVNRGAVKDIVLVSKLAIAAPPSAGDQRMYEPDRNDWAVRFGASRSLPKGALLRAAYGVFHDRPFDNSWQNIRSNRLLLGSFPIFDFDTNYLEPVPAVLQRRQRERFTGDFPSLTMFQPNLRTAYAHSYFAGLQQRFGESWTFELNGAGSLGRKLITTDLVNRAIPDAQLAYMSFRGNQGLSNYHSLSMVARYGTGSRRLHAAYTWSHTIDNQSEPLAGEFFDLSITRAAATDRRSGFAAFSREGDNRADRGNSDFDQRHNLVFYSIQDLPALRSRAARAIFGGWKVAQLAAFRTGFPYTVFAPVVRAADGRVILNNRGSVLPGAAPEKRSSAEGGERLLDRAAFANGNRVGDTGRNAFRGPGLFNIDLSLAKSIPLRWFGEAAKATVRADAFNFLNHANLGNPSSFLTSPDFGIARYGRSGRETGFPAQSPLNETGRQIQFLFRVEF